MTDDSGMRPEERPDFRHVRNWIFDLDNTLYGACNGIFTQIESRMTDYVTTLLGLPRDEARICQKDLYRRYGTTLNGLMREHGADAEDYLNYVHDIDLSCLVPDAQMVDAIGRLPGRRFIFTNGCGGHAARVLDRLGMAGLFEAVWDIRAIGFTPKPQAAAYDAILAAGRMDAHAAALFDDIARNLVPAHALGMTTVWLKTDAPWGKHGPLVDVSEDDIDHQTENLADFLHGIMI